LESNTSSNSIESDQRSNASQADDRHIPLTCTTIFIVLVIATLFIVASRGKPAASVGACSLALNIAVAVFGTNVALTLPGFIYYKILKKTKDYEMTTDDWVIVCSLIGVGLFSTGAGILNIFIVNFHMLKLN
jgi:hypothetical protein